MGGFMTATRLAAWAALGLMVAGTAQAQEATSTVAPAQVDPAAVTALASAIQQALAALPANASKADVEAAIAFAVSQSGQPRAVVLAALKQVANQSPKMAAAVSGYAQKVARGEGEAGTGALAQASQALSSQALGAGPSGGGGGTSDYSRRP